MTREQYIQWRDFAIRMAKTCYADHKRPDGAFVLTHVVALLDDFQGTYHAVRDWDYSENGYDSVSTAMHEMAWEFAIYPWWPIHDELIKRHGHDAELDIDAIASARAEKAREQWIDQYMGPVACCVRAGLDMATEIGGGVVGFQILDLRAMFPTGIPQYINRHYDADLNTVDPDEGIWL